MAKPINEKALLGIVGASIIFMQIVFNNLFGSIYISMVVVWLIWLLYDSGKIKFPIEKRNNDRLTSVGIAVISYAAFLLITRIILVLFAPQSVPNQSMMDVIRLMGVGLMQAAGPFAQDSKILFIVAFGLLVPIVETVLFNLRAFETGYDYLRSRGIVFKQIGMSIILLLLIISSGVTVLHLTSKGGDASQLMVTFAFFTVSGILVWWRKQGLEAVIIHILGNTMASMSQVGFVR